MKESFSISIIIPAYNSAETIAETIESVLAQTFSHWEVIVVNDGSTDATPEIVSGFVKQDSRIRLVSQQHSGVSTARNTGIDLAEFNWLLFLDADDWILPHHLEQLTAILASDLGLDAAHCGWVRVTPEREHYGTENSSSSGDLFDLLAERNQFAIHACVVRRSLVQAVGKFDSTLGTYEDWDLWQRVARTGACFGRTDEVLAHDRIRPGSSSTNALQMLTDGLRVLSQGHKPDPRVQKPHFNHAQGKPVSQLPSLELELICASAGLAIGSGDDYHPMLSYLRNEYDLDTLSINLIKPFVYSIPLATCYPLNQYDQLWHQLKAPINEFLTTLEERLQVPALAGHVRLYMEKIIIQEAVRSRPVTVGTIHAVRVEITEPIPDFLAPESTERLYCTVELSGEKLGTVELPIFQGIVPSRVLADAIAAEFAWSILGYFFKNTLYPSFTIEQESEGLIIRRGSLCLADGLPEGEEFWDLAHEQIGWTVFLQEIWGRSHWDQDTLSQKITASQHIAGNSIVVEVSDQLTDIETSENSLGVVITVGGVAIGTFTIPVKSGLISAQELRSAIILEAGFELCRASVREGLLGKTLQERLCLRERLAEAAVQRHQDNPELKATVSDLISDAGRTLDQILPQTSAVVIACRSQEAIGTSASRWAMLPLAAMSELTELALVTNESLIHISRSQPKPERVVYIPDLILDPSRVGGKLTSEASSEQLTVNHHAYFNRGFFETVFSNKSDPWDYTNLYEQTKYEQSISILPSEAMGRALEVGCAEGRFTKQLAPYVDSLLAADISQIALERAAERCVKLKNVSFMHLNMIKDQLPDGFDLLVCSEVLYYVPDRDSLQTVAQKFFDALKPGGYLLAAHANLVVDEPQQTGFNWDHAFGSKVIGEIIGSTPGLVLVKELHTPLYRIQLFQRQLSGNLVNQSVPEVIEAQHAPLTPDVASMVLWEGGLPNHRPEISIITHTIELPILMYHRVVPTGPSKLTRWQVTPEAFEAQLRYLSDAGFYSATLEDWRIAMMRREPLPGRAVLITFDDGYLDFLTYAWPLLKRYGFSATVFLVADRIGQSNNWDSSDGEDLPLLGWEQIKQLQAQGVEFGSHSASHRHLTSLSTTEVVREGVRSRTILQRELGVPIKAFAYPYGDVDPVVQHIIGACGYVFGLSCQPGPSNVQNSLLALPRIEIEGTDSLEKFVVKLSPL